MSHRPLLLIAGFPKCGTTTLYEVAARQQHLAFQRDKESQFFINHPRASLIDYDRSIRKSSTAIADASPYYACYPFISEKVVDYPALVSVILAIRDPVERVTSEWRMYRARGAEPLQINEALQENLETLSSFDADYADVDSAAHHLTGPGRRRKRRRLYIEASMYAKHIERWRAAVPAEALRIIDFSVMQFQDCINDLDACVRYLGLAPNQHPMPEIRANQSLDPRLRSVYSVFSPRSLRLVRSIVPRSFRSGIRTGLLRFAGRAPSTRADAGIMSDDLAALLRTLSGYEALQAQIRNRHGHETRHAMAGTAD